MNSHLARRDPAAHGAFRGTEVQPDRSARPVPPPIDEACLQADRLALSLRAARERIEIPLSRAARAFTLLKGWFSFGHARLEDHARERLSRSARWLRDLAALGDALSTLPELRDAFTGEDGGRPLGSVAARCIGRVATPESLAAWIELARRVTVRELRDAVRQSRAAGSDRPPCNSRTETGPAKPRASGSEDAPDSVTGSAPGPGPEHGDAEPAGFSTIRLEVPPAIRAAFDEALDLYRAVVGGRATVTSFIEALVAEAASGANPPELEVSPSVPGPARAAWEQALARAAGNWRHLPGAAPSVARLRAAGTLAAVDELTARAGFGGPVELDAQLRGLVALQTEIDARLGELLVEMSGQDAWRRLRFAGVGHYGEERLGLSRTVAEDAARLARAFHRFPLLRDSYHAGRLGAEAAGLVARLLGREPVDAHRERAWVSRAEEATIKRLRDETRLLSRRAVLPPPAGAAAPPDQPRSGQSTPPTDAEWQVSLRREPGLARERVARLGREALLPLAPDVLHWSLYSPEASAAPESILPAFRRAFRARQPDGEVPLRLRLPARVAFDLQSCVWQSRAALRRLAEHTGDDNAPPSLQLARRFHALHRPLPLWVGFLGLLEEFVHVWDDPEAMPKRAGDEVYARDGWRCTAPGCTSRRHLEDHHVVYRSQGGSDSLSNRTCLCRFHHQRGEHGDLASCRGKAPLELSWRLGRRELGEQFRCERRLT